MKTKEKKMIYCLGKKLKHMRVRARKSQQEVASLLEVNIDDLDLAEKGRLDLKIPLKKIPYFVESLKGTIEDKMFFCSLSLMSVDMYYEEIKKTEEEMPSTSKPNN